MSSERPDADRLFAIGDIHGCADELVELLEVMPLERDSVVVTLGDYVDRGPDARGVIEVLMQLGEFCTLIPLKGNHEQMFLDYLEGDDEQSAARFVLNGGGATLRSYAAGIGSSVYVPKSHLSFLRSLRLYHETDEWFFVHAGVPDLPLSELSVEEHEAYMLWARKGFLDSEYRWEKTIVHGHSRSADVTVLPHRICLDTGCAYGGRLTAMGFPSCTTYSVPFREDRDEVPSRPAQSASERRDSKRLAGQLPVRIRHPTGGHIEMTSLNYSSTGLLVVQEDMRPPIPVGSLVDGLVETGLDHAIAFTGRVARRYRAGRRYCYGLSFFKLEEIQRPGGDREAG